MYNFRPGLRLSALVCILPVAALAAVSGEAVYARRCAVCHEQVNDRIPSHDTLKAMPATRILRAMDFGAMMSVAYPMSREERETVAKYLGTDAKDAPPPASAFCSDRKVTVDDKSKFVWNGWSPGSDNARFEPASVAGLTVDQLKTLKLKWAYGFDGDVTAFAAPTVIGNQIFVGSAGGQIQALRADSGCIQWVYSATGPVRAGMTVAPLGSGHVLLFGDQTGWFYAVSAETGKELWKKKIDDHDTARLTATAVVNDGIVYAPVASWEETRSNNPDYICCSFRGSVVAMRIKDGSQVWKSWMVGETKESGKTPAGKQKVGPSGASIWATPAIDLRRKLMYVTTGDNFSLPATDTSDALVALDLSTGKIVWSKQVTENDVSPSEKGPDFDFGSSPMLVKTPEGKDLLVAGQKSGIVYAFDPDKKGELVWQVRVGKGGSNGGVQWGTASDGRYVFAATSDKVTIRTTGPDGQAVRSLDPAKGGGLTALRIADGSQTWFAKPDPCTAPGCSPAQSAALTAIPGIVFSGSYDGHLRAYSAEDGKVLWDFDTLKTFQTVNGVSAKGGAMDGAGPVIVNGMVLVNSGYPRFGGLPGNVLLAFTPDGK
jgi:polyvinyl alcohol dehydrogenase (cytochrome)